MTTNRSGMLVAIAVLATAAIAGGVAIAAGDPIGLSSQSEASDTDTEPMGVQVSAFMQSNAAGTAAGVDNELFLATANSSQGTDREAVVSQRVATLESRLERLEAERDALLEEGDEDSARFKAQLSRLVTQIDGLEQAIDDVEPIAADVGVDTAVLEELRSNASELSGPEVAELARGLAGVTPPGHAADRPGGPPGDNHTDTDGTHRGGQGGSPGDRGSDRGSDRTADDDQV